MYVERSFSAESAAYDLAGRLTNSLDRAGRATRLAWDPFGSPLSVARQADEGFAAVAKIGGKGVVI